MAATFLQRYRSHMKTPIKQALLSICAAMFCVSVLVACGGDGTPAVGALVRDSAGVRVVEYEMSPGHAAPLALSPEPVYSYGSGPGAYLFGRIWDGVLFDDGRAAIYDVQSSQIVVLRPDGAEHSILASSGEGPGEVGLLTSMFTLGPDSLVVLDRGNSRSSLFVNGSLAGTETLAELQRNTSLWPQGIDAAGSFLAATSSYRRGFEEEWLQGHMARLDLETGAVDTVASYDYVPSDGNPSPGIGSVTVADGRFVYTRSDKAEVTWRGADGRVEQTVRWQAEPEYLTAEHLERFEESLLPRYRFANPDAPIARIEEMVQEDVARRAVDLGKPLALFRSPFGDAEGRVWLPAYELGGPREGSPPYIVLSPDGEWLGKVDTPPGLRILDVAGGRVLGVLKDEMDVENVVVYELISR